MIPPRLFLPILLLLPAAAMADTPEPDPLEATIALVEKPRMARLARLQQRLPVPIHPFASDGCSGGLSAGWSLLAGAIPELAERLGERPPWEACCTVHDRAYWSGRGENGYARRREADRALRQCVLDTAARERETWARRLGITPARLDDLMAAVAQSMYLAVRVGGGPCTGLDWRWGYGWPACDAETPLRMSRLERTP